MVSLVVWMLVSWVIIKAFFFFSWFFRTSLKVIGFRRIMVEVIVIRFVFGFWFIFIIVVRFSVFIWVSWFEVGRGFECVVGAGDIGLRYFGLVVEFRWEL